VQSLNGPLHVTFEETTQAGWLYDVIRAYVLQVVVCDPRRNKLLGEGSKGDKPDAPKLAELLRAGLLRSVYHGHEATRILKELVRAYETLSIDTMRTMFRIKAIYRGRGIRTPGVRQRVQWLYEELDHLRSLRKRARQAMLTEGRKHRAFTLLKSIPQLGPIRCALIVATLDTPHRFRTKHQLWAYSGTGSDHAHELGI
jgi:transposase